MVKGYPRREWVKVRGRNEVLDARFYARAAAAHLGMDNWSERRWRELEAMVGTEAQARPQRAPDEPAPEGDRASMMPRRSGWLNRGRGGWLR